MIINKYCHKIEYICQNDAEMNSSDKLPNWKLCPVKSEGSGEVQYLCYLNEKCCEQGCCTVYTYSHLQTWYFWVLLLISCTVFYFCSWYCKKIEVDRRKRLLQRFHANNRNSNQTPRTTPRRQNTDDSVYILDNLQNFDNKTTEASNKEFEPPPKYDEALKMSTVPVIEVHYTVELEPRRSAVVPPSYEEIAEKRRIITTQSIGMKSTPQSIPQRGDTGNERNIIGNGTGREEGISKSEDETSDSCSIGQPGTSNKNLENEY